MTTDIPTLVAAGERAIAERRALERQLEQAHETCNTIAAQLAQALKYEAAQLRAIANDNQPLP